MKRFLYHFQKNKNKKFLPAFMFTVRNPLKSQLQWTCPNPRLGQIYIDFNSFSGELGGEFKRTGAAFGKPTGTDEINGFSYDWENETKTYTNSFYYFVGKD